MAKQFTLGRNERLKSRKQIEQLFKEGKAFNLFPFRVYYSFVSSDSPTTVGNSLITHYSSFTLKFGAGASTRNFKKAVDRNRIKRVIREAWRLQKDALQKELGSQQGQLNLFFIYTAKELPEYKFVYEKTEAIIKKLVKLIHEKNSLGA